MKLKIVFRYVPLLTVLFLMGCSYGCNSNKVNTEYDSEDSVEEIEAGEGDSETSLEDEVQDLEEKIEEIREEEPVVQPGSEDVPEEDFVDQEEPYMPEGADENYEDDEPAPAAESYMREGEAPEVPSQEEDYETQEEPYVDDGEIYEDDYPDR